MVDLFRPHTMTWTTGSNVITTDPNTGFPVAPPEGQSIEVKCRFRPVTPNEFRKSDGMVITKSGRISVDIGSDLPALGQIVTVSEGEKVHFQGPVIEIYSGGHLTRWRIDV